MDYAKELLERELSQAKQDVGIAEQAARDAEAQAASSRAYSAGLQERIAQLEHK